MSLISEALRKAQLEAVQQDREQRRFYMNHGGRPGPNAPAISRSALAIVVLASLCVISAGALLYLTLDRSNAAASPAASPAAPGVALPPVAAPAAVLPAAAPTKVVRVDEPVSPAHETPRRITPRSSKPAAAIPAPAKPRSRTRTEPPAAESASAAAAPRAAERRLERDGFREGETYGSPVLGPLGTEVVLSGITALRGQHVAIINGNTVRAGTAVGPFVVEEIEARRVRLKYVDIVFYVVQ